MTRYKLRYHGTDLRLVPGEIVIGRDEDCAICIQDPVASRRHARLWVIESEVWIGELESRNGVYLNGQRLEKPARLKPGDWFRIGSEEFGLLAVMDDQWEDETGVLDPMLRTTVVPEPPTHPGAADVDDLDPVATIEQSGRAILADEQLPLLERFTSALHLVKVLADTRADARAQALLADAIDLLVRKDARGLLPPLCAARVHAILGRWSSTLAGDSAWSERIRALARAERLGS